MNRAAIVILMPLIFAGHGRAAAVDLADPALRVHADLARHNPPGTALADGLAAARARMPAYLGPWKGLDFIGAHTERFSFEPMMLLQMYGKLACQSDAILVGRAGASLSHLSTWGTAVYTDY
ncbi:MAG TPA: hypothetical protein VNH18_22485, partial [Bryobacteraceae bacterium]|nr:hypothetical protein [Bryobacteraceae bacterium]